MELATALEDFVDLLFFDLTDFDSSDFFVDVLEAEESLFVALDDFPCVDEFLLDLLDF